MARLNTKLLVSACLLGRPVRYDGKSKTIDEIGWLQELKGQSMLIEVCPEVMGGLPVPRPPAEMVDAKIITVQGHDVTTEFQLGAAKVLELCRAHKVTHALLKANSPSCGNELVYDGTFSGTLVDGLGVTARLLKENGIAVYSESQLAELRADLAAAANR